MLTWLSYLRTPLTKINRSARTFLYCQSLFAKYCTRRFPKWACTTYPNFEAYFSKRINLNFIAFIQLFFCFFFSVNKTVGRQYTLSQLSIWITHVPFMVSFLSMIVRFLLNVFSLGINLSLTNFARGQTREYRPLAFSYRPHCAWSVPSRPWANILPVQPLSFGQQDIYVLIKVVSYSGKVELGGLMLPPLKENIC